MDIAFRLLLAGTFIFFVMAMLDKTFGITDPKTGRNIWYACIGSTVALATAVGWFFFILTLILTHPV